MNKSKKTIEIYVDDNGKSPFQNWLETLDKSCLTRVQNRIIRMELGNYGDCKNIGDGINELRLHFGSGYRIYFGEFQNKLIILLCGGDKSTQDSDITKAKQCWNIFLSRKR